MKSIRRDLSDVLFLDIETVAIRESYEKLSNTFQLLWQQKAKQLSRQKDIDSESVALLYQQKAGIFAEFAKIICISVGYFHIQSNAAITFKLKSFFGDDEKVLLHQFKELIDAHYSDSSSKSFSGHNIREFDIPFICRRMLINRIEIPSTLNLSGKKPWQVEHLLDTLHLWRFGDYKNYSSLNLLAEVLNVPSSKDDIDGSQVHQIYYEDGDIDKIRVYCEKDVYCSALVYSRIKGIPESEMNQIQTVSMTTA